MEARAGPSLQEQVRQSLRSSSAASAAQTSRGKQRDSASGPDQRLPRLQPDAESSSSRADVVSNSQEAAQPPRSDEAGQPAEADRRSVSSPLLIINANSHAAAPELRGRTEADAACSPYQTASQAHGSALPDSRERKQPAAFSASPVGQVPRERPNRSQQDLRQVPGMFMQAPQRQRRAYQLPLSQSQPEPSGELMCLVTCQTTDSAGSLCG